VRKRNGRARSVSAARMIDDKPAHLTDFAACRPDASRISPCRDHWVPESGEGNIIVSFGSGKMVKYFDPAYDSVNKPNASRVVEYTFEPAPRKVWEVIIEDESRDPANWAIYGHQRLYNWPGQ